MGTDEQTLMVFRLSCRIGVTMSETSGVAMLDYVGQDSSLCARLTCYEHSKSMPDYATEGGSSADTVTLRGLSDLGRLLFALPQADEHKHALFMIDSLGGALDTEDEQHVADYYGRVGEIRQCRSSTAIRAVLRRRKASACAKASRKKNHNK